MTTRQVLERGEEVGGGGSFIFTDAKSRLRRSPIQIPSRQGLAEFRRWALLAELFAKFTKNS